MTQVGVLAPALSVLGHAALAPPLPLAAAAQLSDLRTHSSHLSTRDPSRPGLQAPERNTMARTMQSFGLVAALLAFQATLVACAAPSIVIDTFPGEHACRAPCTGPPAAARTRSAETGCSRTVEEAGRRVQAGAACRRRGSACPPSLGLARSAPSLLLAPPSCRLEGRAALRPRRQLQAALDASA